MAIYLKKFLFSRNREREEEYGSVFNKASLSLTFLINVVVAGLFAPVVMVTSLASKDVALMLANIFLSTGYSANFIYRLVGKEVSTSELVISTIALSVCLGLTFYFLPMTTAWNLVNCINFVNQIATAINGFFLTRNIIVPPLKKFAENIAQYFGYEIGGNYFFRRPLTVDKDRFAIDRLFRKHYQHDLSQKEVGDVKSKLEPFNNLLNKLVGYINKYSEPLFGSLSSADEISTHEKLIHQLTIDGNSTNCILRIEQKIGFKQTKIALLLAAKEELSSLTNQDNVDDAVHKLRFFKSIPTERFKHDREGVKKDCLKLLEDEITRQETKVNELEACLPKL